jgi:ABC-type transport system involved in multi-copper enzyme maturation permease subunit
MFTGSFALLYRALRLDARLLHTHLFRLGFAVLIYCNLAYAHVMSLRLAAPGLLLFQSMAFLNLGLITLAGVSFFATAISEEKEEETLGLLKMAGINPIGILLGKSTSRLIGAVLLLLVQFPFTLLAITLGGVLLGQVIAVYCSLVAYLVLLANVGLLASVVSRRAGNASGVTAMCVLAYFLAGPVLLQAARGFAGGGVAVPGGGWPKTLYIVATVLNEASAYTRVQQIMQTGFSGFPAGFQVLSNLAFAGLCFGLSWAGFNRFTRDGRTTAAESRLEAASRKMTRRILTRRPGRNPLLWKEFHFVTGGYPAFWVKFVLYGLLTIAVYYSTNHYFSAMLPRGGDGATAAAVVMLVLVVGEASYYVSRIYHDEWRDHTLPLLMMLPMPTYRMAYSKVVGCLPALVPGVFWLVAAWAIMPNNLEEAVIAVVLPSHWFWALLILLFLTLTAFFSLVVRWGALPLALAVMLLGGSFGGCCFSPMLGLVMSLTGRAAGNEGYAEMAFGCIDLLLLALIAALQFDIHRRLEIAASQ